MRAVKILKSENRFIVYDCITYEMCGPMFGTFENAKRHCKEKRYALVSAA